MRQCRCNVLLIRKVNFKEKNLVFPTEKYSSLVLPRMYVVTTTYYSSCRLREVQTKDIFKLIALKSGRSRLREVVAYKRFQTWRFHWETFGIWKTGR